MSGFAGIVYLDGRPVVPAVVEEMVRPLARRGPHGSNVWTNSSAGLGHAALHATPETLHEQQPLVDPTGRWVITADLRIDNRDELIDALDLNEPAITDAQLALDAYRKWGSACVDHLLGDFALVIWDRTERTLFGARDHLGIKPFYYHHQHGRMFVCGSDPDALLAVPEVPRRINESRIADFLVPALEGSDKTSTFYQEIFRLPAAHYITVSPVEMRIRNYWAPDPARELRFARDEEYTEAFREIFGGAVRNRMRSDGPVAVMLSGGLDSAAVAGFAAESEPTGLKTYSCLLRDAGECVETPYVHAMTDHLAGEAKFIFDDELDGLSALVDDHFNRSNDLFDFADIPLVVYDGAKDDGVHVVLDGVDGDVVAAANALYLTEYARAGHARGFVAATSGYANYYGFTRRATVGLWWEQGVKPLIRPRLPDAWREQWRKGRSPGEGDNLHWDHELLKDSLIGHEFAEQIGLAEKLITVTGDTEWGDRPFRENDAITLNAPIISAALERYDRTAASRSIEARHPFFDKRVVEFCLALPLAIKEQGGWAKSIVRRASAGLIPDEILWRRHANSNLNTEIFVRLMNSRRDQMVETIRTGLKEISGHVNHACLSEALDAVSAGTTRSDPVWKVYQAIRLLYWLRRN
jgi:asparagine synthase (glutamine-hydrolysing)